jgi:hypothetical protein
MEVKTVLLRVRELLNLPQEVQDGITSGGGSVWVQDEVNTLMQCFNAVENELAVDYLPLYHEDTVQTETGAVFYTEFSRKPVRILGVKDEKGNALKYTIFPEYLKAQAGKIVVRYTYAPEAKNVYSESDYRLQASERLLAFGVATEYCLMRGRFEEASIWEKKYKQALKTAYKAYPSVVLRTRRWA